MRERGLVMHQHEVLAVLANRQTQFRRPVRFPKWGEYQTEADDWQVSVTSDGAGLYITQPMVMGVPSGRLSKAMQDQILRCPHGGHRDRLWVRETWAPHPLCDDQDPPERYLLRADGANYGIDGRGPTNLDYPDWQPSGWRSATQMPRWASRITLEIVEVRVERMQDISEVDAAAELGLRYLRDGKWCGKNLPSTTTGMAAREWTNKPLFHFIMWWDSINAKRGLGWDSNPWVWVVTFKRIEV